MSGIGSSVMRSARVLLASLVIAGGAGMAKPDTAAAISGNDSILSCVELAGTAIIGFPINADGRASIYAFRVDRGQWQYSPWFYFGPETAWYVLDRGTWTPWPYVQTYFGFPADSRLHVGGQRLIEAWEYRHYHSTNSGTWVYLGACTTSDAWDNGIVFQ